jgi:hypothetical protein
MGHGLVIRKMQAGDVGLCTGNSNMALFRVATPAEMVEVLRQLSNQAVQLQNESQWADRERDL